VFNLLRKECVSLVAESVLNIDKPKENAISPQQSPAAEPLNSPSSQDSTFETVAKSAARPAARTTGLWAFDALLYPILTNFVVFGISVYATYLTSKGGMKNAAGKPLHGWWGEMFHNRGNGVVNFFKKTGMSHEQADVSKMVFFSFVDGTAVAPMVKLLEDRREKIAKAIDDKLGTTPEDEIAAYKSEPKQSWFSVIAGRIAVLSIVVPTAYILGKMGLNDKLFNDPGKKFGAWMAKKPNLAKHFGNLDIKELGRVGVFEGFYTSVCTAGLYVTSRFIARKTNKKKTGEIESILDDNLQDFPQEKIAAVTGTKPKASEQLKKPRKSAPASRFTDYAKPTESPQITL